MSELRCKAAEDDRRHQLRKVHGAEADDPCKCGYCHSCHYARKRHRRAVRRSGAVRRLYGWAQAEIDALKRFQRGRCGVCGRRVGVRREPSVEHDHGMVARGVPVRYAVFGLVCDPCNQFIGYIGRDPQVGVRLFWFLTDPPAPHVLRQLDNIGQDEAG